MFPRGLFSFLERALLAETYEKRFCKLISFAQKGVESQFLAGANARRRPDRRDPQDVGGRHSGALHGRRQLWSLMFVSRVYTEVKVKISSVPLDLAVRTKATLLAATFLIVSLALRSGMYT